MRQFSDLLLAQEALVRLDVDTPVEYAQHETHLPVSVGCDEYEINLPAPSYQASTIVCNVGRVSGLVLRVPRTHREPTVTARYYCPSRVLNADEIGNVKATLSAADPEGCSRLAEAKASHYRQPVLFISHRWNADHHPDPDGTQLGMLQRLNDCFLIYDYSSFPQNTKAAEDEQALRAILAGMNELISDVVVLAATDYLERGWCIYEYLVASMRASIICDEINEPGFVMLRNVAATRPPMYMGLRGSGIESGIQNAKSQATLKAVSGILPRFNKSKFTVEGDREVVRALLISELKQMLPLKMEYEPYLGEWLNRQWDDNELRAAFSRGLDWKADQVAHSFRPFEPKVPSALAEAVANGYQLDRMPLQSESTWATLVGLRPFEPLEWVGKGVSKAFAQIALIVAGVIAVLLLLLSALVFLLVRWIFF
jgi:hypothetical protein